jgi:WD40 repeat protein
MTMLRFWFCLVLASIGLGNSTSARADMLGHGAMVNAVVVSPDGRRVLSASWDYSARLWDLAGQREIRSLDGHTASVNAAVFLPDGKTGLTGSWDHKIIRWNLETGEPVARLEGHVNNVAGLALSRDGRLLASAS